jgi:hypothetical protein
MLNIHEDFDDDLLRSHWIANQLNVILHPFIQKIGQVDWLLESYFRFFSIIHFILITCIGYDHWFPLFQGKWLWMQMLPSAHIDDAYL